MATVAASPAPTYEHAFGADSAVMASVTSESAFGALANAKTLSPRSHRPTPLQLVQTTPLTTIDIKSPRSVSLPRSNPASPTAPTSHSVAPSWAAPLLPVREDASLSEDDLPRAAPAAAAESSPRSIDPNARTYMFMQSAATPTTTQKRVVPVLQDMKLGFDVEDAVAVAADADGAADVGLRVSAERDTGASTDSQAPDFTELAPATRASSSGSNPLRPAPRLAQLAIASSATPTSGPDVDPALALFSPDSATSSNRIPLVSPASSSCSPSPSSSSQAPPSRSASAHPSSSRSASTVVSSHRPRATILYRSHPASSVESPSFSSTLSPARSRSRSRFSASTAGVSVSPPAKRLPLRSSMMIGQHAMTGAMASTSSSTGPRYLLTVIPPDHIPHDPPHPRTSQHCSGYGPPQHFKRGTLVPLYPTLSSQLAAIAREYGLPSTGGIVIYLLSTIDPFSVTATPLPGSAGLAGADGPRIGEEAWSLLWSRLFEEDGAGLSTGPGDTDDEYDDDYAPPVPPIPLSHRGYHHHQSSFTEADALSPPQTQRHTGPASDEDNVGGSDGPDGDLERASFSSDTGDHESSTYSSTAAGAGDRSASVGTSQIGSATTAGTSTRPSSVAARSPSSASHSIGRGHPSNNPRFSSAASTRGENGIAPQLSSFASQPNMRHPSRQSVRSISSRMYQASGRATSLRSFSTSSSGVGPAVVVGKVEFDIDRRQGGRSKWYENWIAGASASPSVPAMTTTTDPKPSTHGLGRCAPDTSRSGDESLRSSPAEHAFAAGSLPGHPPAVSKFTSASSPTVPERRFPVEHTKEPILDLKSELPVDGSETLSAPASATARGSGLKPLELGALGIGAASAATQIARTSSTQHHPTEASNAKPIAAFDSLPGHLGSRSSLLSPSAASAYSLAAMAGHSDDDEDHATDTACELVTSSQEPTLQPSAPAGEGQVNEHAPLDDGRDSIRSSYASSMQSSSSSERGGEQHGYANLADENDDDDLASDQGLTQSYRPLDDDINDVVSGMPSIASTLQQRDSQRESVEYQNSSDPLPDEADISFASPMDLPDAFHHQTMDSEMSHYADSEGVIERVPTRNFDVGPDPLSDIFGSDERTWREIADDDTHLEPAPSQEASEITSLGLQHTRVASLVSTIPEGVLEERIETEEDHESISAQDDIADVKNLLKIDSTPRPVNRSLASPIRLDSAATSAESTRVFAATTTSDNEDLSLPAGKRHSPDVLAAFPPQNSPWPPLVDDEPPTIETNAPSTVESSPSSIPVRKQRQGWTNIPPVVDKSLSASSSMASIANVEIDEPERDSTVGLMENLDDLERALADLSPTTSRRRVPTSPLLSARDDATPIVSPIHAPALVPLPQQETPSNACSAVVSSLHAVPETTPVSAANAEPSSLPIDFEPPKFSTVHPLPSPTLSSRPLFRYGNASPLVPPVSSDGEEPAARVIVPPRKASLATEFSQHTRTVTEADAPLLPPPRLFDTEGSASPSRPSLEEAPSSPRSGGFYSELPDTTRTPRSTSLSRRADSSPRQIPLPPSPMPQHFNRFAHPIAFMADAQVPVASDAEIVSDVPPPPPVPVVSDGSAPTVANSKAKNDSLPSRSSRSSAKSARNSKPSKAASQENTDAVDQTTKSPAFFGKSTFSKLNGLFSKSPKTTAENVASPPVSPLLSSEAAFPVRPSQNDETRAFQPSDAAPLAVVAPGQTIEEIRAELFSRSTTSAHDASSLRIVQQPPSLYERPSSPAGDIESSALSPRSVADVDSLRPTLPVFGLASSLRPARTFEPLLPSSPTFNSETFMGSAFSLETGSFDSDLAIRSPISDYNPVTPGRIPSSPGVHPVSAPATPSALRDEQGHTRPNNAARFSRMRPRHRLSADIDQLLSQMNEIDFGDEESMMTGAGSEDETQSVASTSKSRLPSHDHFAGTAPLSPSLPPVEELDIEERVAPTTPNQDWPPLPALPEHHSALAPRSRETVALSHLGDLMTM
ncbi:BZ3500_MvSof-1268-A1-R1_Chr7-3g09598 [Microbotryum saponariae]|uniref:BZ3500_MvSof-1268-A1-R1_Chr7-3g09598 protein n=1 Tax=Microbotryum saponariae TaxID=289078 RepID=A0A2X0LSM8_9BASI|nr:BZ3500_MvSof-1268-A1-R1_Chr7-3g09598 [Microbotryum saponariae]